MKRTKPPNNKKTTKNNGKNNHSNNGNYSNGNGHNGVPNGNGLTEKQRAFVREYLVDLNSSQAALRAGYAEASAPVIGCENLKKPNIQAAIQEEMKLREERTRVTQDKVVRELAKLAFSNMRSFVEWGPNYVTFIDSEQISDDDTAAVAEVSQTTTKDGGTVRFKLHDKKGALELLGKHLGMFSDTIKHIGEGGGPITHKFDFTDTAIKSAFDKLYGKEEKK